MTFKKPCVICGKTFQPSTKYSKTCEPCLKKIWKETNEARKQTFLLKKQLLKNG